MSSLRRFLTVLLMVGMGLSALGPLPQLSAGAGRDAGQPLNVIAAYTVTGSETWDVVYVRPGGTLTVPSGTSLSTKSIFLLGGGFLVPGGTVIVTQTNPGSDAVIMGDCTEFNISNSGQLTLTAPAGASSMDFSQGGESIVQVNASISVTVTGGAKIQCTGGAGTSITRPWTTSPLGGYVSAGGRGFISLGGPLTPKVEISGGAKLITTGEKGGRAADGKPGSGSVGGMGGGFSNGGTVSGYVGSGGEGFVEINGISSILNDVTIQCTGGRGGDAGNGAQGSTTSGGTGYPGYYYGGGGGGGGFGGGNGGSDWQQTGKSGSATENVGAGGYAEVNVNCYYGNVTIKKVTVTLKGGDGGTPGNGGQGGNNPPYYYYYSAAGGGGGFGGGGGGSSYSTGGSGSASGNVGSGGEANMTVVSKNLTIDNLRLTATGGNSQKGGTGGDGYSGGGGGGGYGGGGGGGSYYGGGTGGASANCGSGGNGTFNTISENLTMVNSSVALLGGNAGSGGTGGRGGTYGGGGGGGYGGGGGDGYYNYNGGGGTGSCNFNVGRGGMALIRLSTGVMWVNASYMNLTGGTGGNGGGAGLSGGQGGGGGGGYAGGGGGSYYYTTPSEGTAGARVGDGGDAQLEFYCTKGSIPADGNKISLQGGVKGDGKTAKGGGQGGSGKGRSTSNGALVKNIPRLIPNPTGPADNSLFNNKFPPLTWLRQLDGVVFPSTSDAIDFYEVQIDNDTTFQTPDEVAKDIDPAEAVYTPKDLRGGHYFWHVRALYEGGKSPGWSETHDFVFNGPPIQLRSIPTLSLPEDSNLTHALDLKNYFTDDVYGNELTYSIAYEQAATMVHAEMDGSWLNLYALTQDWFGAKRVSVRVTDKGGIPMISNNFTVTVTPVNDPPFFLPIPDVTVTEDESFMIDLSPYVSDVDNSLNQLRIAVISPYTVVDELNLTLNYPREIGSDRLNITLTDGIATVWTWLTVKISAVNDYPMVQPMPAVVTNEDTNITLDLSLFANDEEDMPNQLKWRTENVPVELFTASVDDRNVLKISPLPDVSGEGVMLLVVRDTGGNEVMLNLTVRVLPVDDPPIVSGIPNLVIAVNALYKLDIKQYVHDVDNDLSELKVTVNSLYASVSGFVITFQYPNEENLETETVRILVSDGKATGHQDITVLLKFPPTFTEAIGEISVEATKETTLDLTRYVYDREDGPTGLKYAVSHVDRSLIEVSVDSGGQMKVRSVKEKTGTNDITLTVTDTDGNKANQTIRISVTAKKSIFGGGEGMDWLIWVVPVVAVAAIIGVAGGMYMVASRRKRRLEDQQAKEDREMLPTADDRMVTLAAPAGSTAQPAAVPPGKVCFACGSKLIPLGLGSFQCTKCGRNQK